MRKINTNNAGTKQNANTSIQNRQEANHVFDPKISHHLNYCLPEFFHANVCIYQRDENTNVFDQYK